MSQTLESLASRNDQLNQQIQRMKIEAEKPPSPPKPIPKPAPMEEQIQQANSVEEFEGRAETSRLQVALETSKKFMEQRTKAMEKQMDDVKKLLSEKDIHIARVNSELRDANTALSTVNSQLKIVNNKVMSLSEENIKIKSEKTSTEQIMNTLKKEAININKEREDRTKLEKAKDLKISRLSDEVEKWKALVGKSRSENKDEGQNAKSQISILTQKLTRSEKQKDDLLNALKKAMQLVEALKRQKMHLESAKLLGFTEKEFESVLELSA